MDISTPWTPSYEGKPCKPCAWYASVVEENIHPNCIQHADWAQKNLEPQLGKRPLARDALWEGILALWRLSLQEGDGRKEESWRVLVFAWLVRCRLCGAPLGVNDDDDDIFAETPPGPLPSSQDCTFPGRP